MELSLEIRADKLLDAFSKAPQAVRDHLRIAVKSSAVEVQREARRTHRFESRSGAIERSVSVDFPEEMVARVFLDSTHAPHAVFQHEGTGLFGPHHSKYPILPRKRKMLRWVAPTRNGFAFSRGVMHPGVKRDPFLYVALETRRASVQAKIDQATDSAIKAAGL